jgi:hypothetical protein
MVSAAGCAPTIETWPGSDSGGASTSGGGAHGGDGGQSPGASSVSSASSASSASSSSAGGGPVCTPGATQSCYGGPPGTEGVGLCKAGAQTCNADGSSFGPCVGDVLPAPAEDCSTPDDDDCNGVALEGDCVCIPNAITACYDGPSGTLGVGICAAGQATCDDTGTILGPCVGEVLPAPEVCATTADEDCSGPIDCGVTLWTLAATGGVYGEQVAVGAGDSVYAIAVANAPAGVGGPPLAYGGGLDVVVAKYDALGQHLWSKGFGDAGDQQPIAIAVDHDDGVLVAGSYAGTIDFGLGPLVDNGGDASSASVFLAKFDPQGLPVWSRSFRGGSGSSESPEALGVLPSGGLALGGWYFGGSLDLGSGPLPPSPAAAGYVAAWDAAGALQWVRSFAGPNGSYVHALAVDPAGDIYVCGTFDNSLVGTSLVSAGGWDAFVAKLDQAGGVIWARSYGDFDYQTCAGLALTASGNPVVMIENAGVVDFGDGPLASSGGSDVAVAELDGAGQPIWSRIFGDASGQTPRGLAVAPDGSVVFTVRNESTPGTVDFGTGPLTGRCFVVKLNAAGAASWAVTADPLSLFGVAADSEGNALAANESGGGLLVRKFGR